jgi:hypothetical protein
MNPWRVPAYLPYLQPPLASSAVAELEIARGITLPAALLACLEQQNGGYIRLVLEGEGIPHHMIWGIGPHFPNLGDYHEALDPDLWDENAEDGVWMPRDSGRLVPFDGDGHWYLCLDYRTGPDPAVSYVDVEVGSDRRVADSFDDYLAMLKPDHGANCLGLRDVTSVDEVARRLQAFVTAEFGSANADGNGYPVRRCGLPSNGGGAEWIWLSPNRVPRGFVRASDSRYSELKDLLPGEALRFPDYPDVVVVVGCTESVRNRLIEWCERAGMIGQVLLAAAS